MKRFTPICEYNGDSDPVVTMMETPLGEWIQAQEPAVIFTEAKFREDALAVGRQLLATLDKVLENPATMSASHDLKVRLLLAAEAVVAEWDAYRLVASTANANSPAVEELGDAVTAMRAHDARMP